MRILWFLLPGIAAGLSAAALTPLAKALALRLGAIDTPGPRKIHQIPTPRLGGLAVVATVAALLGLLAAVSPARIHVLDRAVLLGLALGAIPIVLVSIIDDIRPLAALPKGLAHLLGATLAVGFGGVHLGDEIHLFDQSIHIGWAAIPISLVWLVGITSAFNIIDGLDGLSAGLGLISAASLTVVSLVAGSYQMAIAASILAGALAGFLPWNIHPAKIYLGDTGATAIGFTLGCLTLAGGSTTSAGLAVVFPLLVLGVPIADTLLSMARRLVRKFDGDDTARVFGADRNHIHHRLLALGFSHTRAVYILHGAGMLLALTGLASLFMSQQKAAVLLGTILAGAAIGVAKLGYDEFAIVRRGVILRFYQAPVLRTAYFIVFADILMAGIAVYLAVGLKYDDWALEFQRVPAMQLGSLLPACLVLAFASMNIYRRHWRSASATEMMSLALAVLVASGIAFAASRLFLDPPVPTSLLTVAALIVLVLEPGVRSSYKIVLEMTRRSNAEGDPVLIYGAGKAGALALRELVTNEKVPMKPVGFIDDDPDIAGKFVNGYPVLGGVESLSALVTATRVKGVVVASPKISTANRKRAADACAESGVWIRNFTIGFNEGSDETAEKFGMVSEASAPH